MRSSAAAQLFQGQTMADEVGGFKVVLVGAAAVGKTCIVKRGTTGAFDAGTMSTLGASYASKLVSFGDALTRLLIWDTAGQERYRGITPMYYRNATAVVIVYSIADHESFREVDISVRSIKENVPPGVLLFLVGNKSDLDDSRQVTIDDAQEKATEIGAVFGEVSAKTGAGINELFVMVGAGCVDLERAKDQEERKAKGKAGSQTVQLSPKGKRGKSCC